jgi:hypothetical protein
LNKNQELVSKSLLVYPILIVKERMRRLRENGRAGGERERERKRERGGGKEGREGSHFSVFQ